MSMLLDAEKERVFGKPYSEYAKTLSTEELVDLIYCQERILDSDYIGRLDCMDSIILRHDLLRDECVRRLEMIACGKCNRVVREAEE